MHDGTAAGDTLPDAQRRSVLRHGSLLALLFTVNGAPTLLSPRAAHAQGVTAGTLNAAERAALQAIGEVLVPGARTAGIAEYVDQQLGVPFGECILAARVLDIAPPLAGFYHAALAGLDAAAQKLGDAPFASLPATLQVALVSAMRTGSPEGWSGPPAPFVYFVLRGDAVDVFYGTVETSERLMGVPYMAHLLPPRPW